MLSTTTTFIREYFEQNPISQLSIIALRNGIAEQVSDMSGNPQEHIKQVQLMVRKDAAGNPSLENGLEMARVGLKGAPSHGTREVLLVMGALYSSDPGDVHRTIEALVADKITAKVIGLAAQVAVCRELVAKTNNGDISGYSIALNEEHFKDLMLNITTPPASTVTTSNSSSLLMMGFPSRTVDPQPSLCACHGRPSREGYRCSRCSTKVCGLPAECPACGLTLILSTHLARSYHHLFPLVNWQEVSWSHARLSQQCFACQRPFPAAQPHKSNQAKQREDLATQRKQLVGGAIGLVEPAVGRDSGSQRFECGVCHYHFCIDCDIFAHEVVHNCPGCQSGGAEAGMMGETEHEVVSGDSMNGVEAS